MQHGDFLLELFNVYLNRLIAHIDYVLFIISHPKQYEVMAPDDNTVILTTGFRIRIFLRIRIRGERGKIFFKKFFHFSDISEQL